MRETALDVIRADGSMSRIPAVAWIADSGGEWLVYEWRTEDGFETCWVLDTDMLLEVEPCGTLRLVLDRA